MEISLHEPEPEKPALRLDANTQIQETPAHTYEGSGLSSDHNAEYRAGYIAEYNTEHTAEHNDTVHEQVMTAAEHNLAAKELVTTLQMATEQKQSVDTMMNSLLEEMQRARRHRQMLYLRFALVLTLVVLLFFRSHGHYQNYWIVIFYGFGGVAAADRTAARRRATARALGVAGDPRAVGVLALVARNGDRQVKRVAIPALLTLLPRVRADHAASITAEQMDALLDVAFQSSANVQIAILKALEQIGDRRAIPLVENLTMSSDPQIRAQARQCLPFLQARARRTEQSMTLLRGAASPGMEATERELLRPATQSAEAIPSDQLLRPTNGLTTSPPDSG